MFTNKSKTLFVIMYSKFNLSISILKMQYTTENDLSHGNNLKEEYDFLVVMYKTYLQKCPHDCVYS